MDLTLSPEHHGIRDAARAFVAGEVLPHVRDWDRNEEMDRSIVAKLAEIGFLGGPIPLEYGGSGLDNLSYCLIIEELGKGDSSVRGVISVNVGLVGKTILKWGTEDQKKEWLPALCSGDALGCYALTEPGAGSDAAALTTKATRDGDSWILSGTKMFITNGGWATHALVFARTREPGPGRAASDGITCFVVETSTEGFSTTPVKGKLGLRAQDTAELILEGVQVPDANRLGDEGAGFTVAMSALDNGRMSLASGCVGIAQGCLDASVAYAKERETFGGPIARYQLIQELLADMAVETEAARLLVWKVAAMADAGEKHTVESSHAKYFASEVAVRAANSAVQIFGGYGYIDEYPVGKYLRDARVTTLYEGTSQIQKLIIGRALTGESAFS